MIRSIPLNNGMSIPQLGFGTLNVQPDRQRTASNAEKTAEIVGLALQVSYRHIDRAQQHGTQRGVGEAIAASGFPRDQVYVTTKLGRAGRRRRAAHGSDGGLITGSDILMDGGVTPAYWYGDLAEVRSTT
jgi:2,5-diketo-D-gluconate reductase A